MSAKFYSRIRQSADAGGTGDFAFTGTSASAGFRSWDAAEDGVAAYYFAFLGTNWETGYAVWDADSQTLVGRTLIESSTGSLIDFAAGPVVFSDVPGSYLSSIDELLNLHDGIGTFRVTDGVMLAKGSIVDSDNAVCIGVGDDSGDFGVQEAPNGVAIGHNALCGPGGAVAIGYFSVAIGPAATALGFGAQANGEAAFAAGFAASAVTGSFALGAFAQAVAESSFAAGNGAAALGTWSIALGSGAVAGLDGTFCAGATATADFKGEEVVSLGAFETAGDAKSSRVTLRHITTDATPTELAVPDGTISDAPSDYIELADNSTYLFSIDIVARKSPSGTDYKAWSVQFCVTRETGAASTALVGSPSIDAVGASGGAAAWDVTVTADTTNGRPAIKVTGAAATTIRWVATAQVTKVSN